MEGKASVGQTLPRLVGDLVAFNTEPACGHGVGELLEGIRWGGRLSNVLDVGAGQGMVKDILDSRCKNGLRQPS